MNKQYHVSDHQDLKDAQDNIKELRFPYVLMAKSSVPTKAHAAEYTKRSKLMAYFFRSVVPTYSEHAGVSEEQARAELQIKFARCEEVLISEAGEYDTVWLKEDRLRVFEEGKMFRVQSVASMSNSELIELVDKSKNYILITYGAYVPERINNFKTKEV